MILDGTTVLPDMATTIIIEIIKAIIMMIKIITIIMILEHITL